VDHNADERWIRWLSPGEMPSDNSSHPVPEPGLGQYVTLCLSPRDRTDGEVEAIDALTVDAVCSVPIEGLDHLVRGGVFLEFASSDGMWRLEGELQRGSPVRSAAAEYRYRFCGRREALLLRRREFLRARLSAPIWLSIGRGPILVAETVDLGGGGALLRGAAELSLGELREFSLHALPSHRAVHGSCRVVRELDDGTRAVQFVQIADRDQRELIRYIHACQTAERPRPRIALPEGQQRAMGALSEAQKLGTVHAAGRADSAAHGRFRWRP
jgi:hypothetical protein